MLFNNHNEYSALNVNILHTAKIFRASGDLYLLAAFVLNGRQILTTKYQFGNFFQFALVSNSGGEHSCFKCGLKNII